MTQSETNDTYTPFETEGGVEQVQLTRIFHSSLMSRLPEMSSAYSESLFDAATRTGHVEALYKLAQSLLQPPK